MDTNIMLWQAVIFGPDDTPVSVVIYIYIYISTEYDQYIIAIHLTLFRLSIQYN